MTVSLQKRVVRKRAHISKKKKKKNPASICMYDLCAAERYTPLYTVYKNHFRSTSEKGTLIPAAFHRILKILSPSLYNLNTLVKVISYFGKFSYLKNRKQ